MLNKRKKYPFNNTKNNTKQRWFNSEILSENISITTFIKKKSSPTFRF